MGQNGTKWNKWKYLHNPNRYGLLHGLMNRRFYKNLHKITQIQKIYFAKTCNKMQQKNCYLLKVYFGQTWTNLDKFKVQFSGKFGIVRTILKVCFVNKYTKTHRNTQNLSSLFGKKWKRYNKIIEKMRNTTVQK